MWLDECIAWCLPGASRSDVEASQGGGDDGLRRAALGRVERRRNLTFHLAAFGLGLLILGGSWVGIEYLNEGWPDRISSRGKPGDWDPTILIVLLVWGLLLAIHLVRMYLRRPYTEDEVGRALRRVARDRD